MASDLPSEGSAEARLASGSHALHVAKNTFLEGLMPDGPTRSSLQRSKSWGGSSSDRESSYSSSAVNFPVWQPSSSECSSTSSTSTQGEGQLRYFRPEQADLKQSSSCPRQETTGAEDTEKPRQGRELAQGGALPSRPAVLLPTNPQDEDVAGGAERADWSLGSEQHASGECKPCLFVKSPNGCKHGLACSYCHVSHHEGQHRNRRVRPCKTTRDRCKKKIGELCSIIGSDSAAPEQIPAKLQQDCQLLLGRSHYSRRLVQAQQEEVFSLLGFGAGSSSSSAVAELCQTGKLSL
eukprot:CAMPEP_0115063882 /NCGR_PEP_ID=MMETSP0227-20121206/9359_1 /TAXON_ID=89957 /ORGANISM="Polarella glacialis, Strain CCMP 1383" /LENGTH=293 /DNA_ID=CAMNT_0002449443 /DNA_START=63 /DNA_END=944 /DNA_ORIENTATION=-